MLAVALQRAARQKMSGPNAQAYLCARRHQSRPSLIIDCLSSKPICLPCAASTIRTQSNRPLRISVAAALDNLNGETLHSKSLNSDSASVTILDTLDALCFILCEAAGEEDPELVTAIARAISHICFSCDKGADEVVEYGDDRYKVCAAVLTHVFQFLKDHVTEDLCDRRLRAAYAQLLSTMVQRSGMLVDRVRSDWEGAETFLSMFDVLPVDMEPWCCSLLLDLVSTSGSNAVGVTADILCAFLVTGSKRILTFLNEHVTGVLNALQQATSIDHREKLLSLLLLLISMPQGNGNFENEAIVGSKSKKEKTGEHSLSGTLLAEALKPCVISPSSDVRSLVADIINVLLDPKFRIRYSKCSQSLFAPASCFTDYLIEAIRHPLKYSRQDEQDCAQKSSLALQSALAAPVLRTLGQIATQFSCEMTSKWRYALPVICKSALGYDSGATSATFKLFGKSCCTWPTLQKEVAIDITQMFLQSGARLRSALEVDSAGMETEKLCFLTGIEMLSELTEYNCFPASASVELLDCAECIGLLAPHVTSGSNFVYNTLKLMLETEYLSERATRVKSVALDIWGCHVATLFSKSTDASRQQLVNGLNILSAALDVRLYKDAFELHEAALPLFREISFAQVSSFFVEDHHKSMFQSDCGVGSSEALWNSSDQNIPTEHTEGAVDPHSCDKNSTSSLAETVRTYFSRIICSLSDVSHELGLKSAFGYRTLERYMPLSVAALIAQLSSPNSPEELLVALNILLASIIHSHSTIADPSLIQKALMECAESTNLVETASYRECVLPLVRMMFYCSEGIQQGGTTVIIPKTVCAIALAHKGLDIVRSDSDFFFHVLNCHDTELRVLAWNTLAESRIRGDPDWKAIDVRLADQLGTSTSTAKNFVTSCLEGSHDVRCLALDLMTIRPESVPTALLKVGLPSLIMKELEARQVLLSSSEYESTPRSLIELEKCESCLHGLIAIATNAVKHGEREDLHRMLMMLVDVYGGRSDKIPSHLKARAGNLDDVIVRCLVSAMNVIAEPAADKDLTVSDLIFPYLVQTMSIAKMKEHLLSAVSRIIDDGSVTSLGWSDDDEFELQGVACLLDYVARHQIRLLLAKFSNEVAMEKMSWSFSSLLKSESDWNVLLYHSRADIGHHANNCRQASCMQLLHTLVVHGLLCQNDLIANKPFEILGPDLLASTVAAAASPRGIFQASTQEFLLVLVAYEELLFEKTDLRLSNLASHQAFHSYLVAKFVVHPSSLNLPELQYLVFASIRKFPVDIRRSISLVEIGKSFSSIMETFGNTEEALYKAARALFSSAVNSCVRPSQDVTKILQTFEIALKAACDRHRGALEQAEGNGILTWNQGGLLIGCRAVIAAPLSFTIL